MPSFRTLAAATLSALLAGACASPPQNIGVTPTPLETSLAQALLEAAEREGRVSKVLVAPGVSPGMSSVLSALRPVAPAKSAEIGGLAEGQLLVQAVTLGPKSASLTARLGPVPRPAPKIGHLACGTGLTVSFNLVGGHWQQGDLQILQC